MPEHKGANKNRDCYNGVGSPDSLDRVRNKKEASQNSHLRRIIHTSCVRGRCSGPPMRQFCPIRLLFPSDLCMSRHTFKQVDSRSEEHTSELQSPYDLVCR